MATEATTKSSDNILSDKVSRALQVRTDSAAMRASLQALSASSEAIIDARSVRTAMEQDALQQAKLLQSALGEILDHVKNLQEGCTQVARTASQLREAASQSVVTQATASSTLKTTAEIDTTERTTEKALADRLSEAFAARDAAKQRVEGVQRFLEKFDLSQEDSELLENYNFEDLGGDLDAMETDVSKAMTFLSALERVREIRQSLQSTFSSLDEEASAGLGANSALRIMESVSEKQERGYERLYTFLQKHVDSSSPFVQHAITTLRHVPAFYSHMMELVASSRRAVVTRHFLLALTQGVDGGTPLELKAHDSVACKLCFLSVSMSHFRSPDVQDMLAHIFKAFSVEADLARNLLNPDVDEEEATEESVKDSVESGDDPMFPSEPTVTEASLLEIAVSGLCRPLKTRLVQVISNLSSHGAEEDDDDDDDFIDDEATSSRKRLTQLYEICGLMLFYVSTLEKGLKKMDSSNTSTSPTNPLITCLEECVKEGEAAYEASIRVYGAMLDQASAASGESQATVVHQLIVQLSKIQCPVAVDRILSIEWATETLLNATKCTSLDDTVTLTQALHAAQSTNTSMSMEAFGKLSEDIAAKEKVLVDQMVETEAAQVLELCGISGLVEAFQRWQSSDLPLAQFPGLSQEDATTAIQEFYESLYSPPIPSLEGVVRDPAVRKRVRGAICQRVCEWYEKLHTAMSEPGAGYSNVQFLGHSPQQVTSLFTV